MHPLVHAWSRTRLNDLEQVSRSKTRTILACSIEPDYDINNYELCGKLVKHVNACYGHVSNLKLDEMYYYDDEMERIPFMFERVGEWKKAEEMRRRLLEGRAKLGGDTIPIYDRYSQCKS